jgi:hypothetical protein
MKMYWDDGITAWKQLIAVLNRIAAAIEAQNDKDREKK